MQDNLLTFKDTSVEQMQALLALALNVKKSPSDYRDALKGKSLVALFEKPSLRTRVSFDIGIQKLGGHLVYLDSQSNNLAGREDTKDMALNLSCWCDGIIARVFKHETLEELAEYASVPVVNALCDLYHPCQALADYLAMAEIFHDVKGRTMAYIGDGNNVTHSLLIVGALLGVNQVVVTPVGHEANSEIVALAKNLAQQTGASITELTDITKLVQADVIYTDTWLSMGDNTPLAQIKETFMPYQVNEALMQQCGAKYVMHCQPAHRDLEITSSLIDSPASLLMMQAENRMHAQNAILITLLGNYVN
ncbi:MAG: ornithine carbamoyltransferase [Glaciecola sp.]|jgi:ornithine carbamoyltransferase|nr:ornithine carbamoyltransferase [Glaciecola sp.]MDG1469481.1 ornithine carbamoyltransferase [Glaciecola sp.]MDG1922342.1 ornithine carbamoyltransferase [Glaciecola sp.]